MKTLNSIEELLTEKATDNKKAIGEYEEKISAADLAIQKSNDSLTAAEANADLEEYKKAKDDIWSAVHAKELYQKQIEKLLNNPLITRKEYLRLLTEITSIAKETQEAQNDRAAELVSELKDISEESLQTDLQANKLLHVLQREVYKEPEGSIPSPNGGTTWSMDKKYVNNETVHNFYRYKIAGSQLEERAGRTESQQTSNSWNVYR